MKMKPTDIAKYPNFAYYVRHDIPTLIKVPSVVHNLRVKGKLTSAEIADALKWNSGPGIKILKLAPGVCRAPGTNGPSDPGSSADFGCTRGSSEVEIDADTVQDFETGPYSAKVGKNKNGKNVFIVGVTLLHELCHLGHFKHNEAESGEAGNNFEQATYGQSIP